MTGSLRPKARYTLPVFTGKIPLGGNCPENVYIQCTNAGDGQTSCKYGWPALSDFGAVTKPTHETHWNLLGCPKLENRSQPLMGRSSPYVSTCGGILLFNKFLSGCRYMPWLRRYSPTNLCDGAQMANFWQFFASCIFSEPRAAHFRPAFYIRTKATSCVQVW